MSRALVTTVGPLVAASATKIGASQKAANSGTNVLVLNGAAADAVANDICLSQTPAGAGNLTLNGSICTTNLPAPFGANAQAAGASAIAYIIPTFGGPRYIYITCAGNESGRTFTVTGTVQSPTTFGPGVVVTETITGANASTVSSVKQYSTIISIAVDAATAGAITVGVNGVATLDTARRVLFTDGGNDSAVIATVNGTDWNGDPISETVTLTSGSTVATVQDFLTVTSITTNAAIATTITVGTNGVASSCWLRLDELGSMGPVSIQVDGSGTINWTVQQTLNDPNVITNALPTPTYLQTRQSVNWVNHPDLALVASTVTTGVQGSYATPPKFVRLLVNSQTNPAYATISVLQVYQS